MPTNIENFLDNVYEKYHKRCFLPSDPLHFVYRYEDDKDREIAAFICAIFAYGQVKQIKKFLDSFLSILGKSPYEYFINFKCGDGEKFKGLYYRFQDSNDILLLALTLSKILKEHGSLEAAFASETNIVMRERISKFSKYFKKLSKDLAEDNNLKKGKYFNFLTPDPEDGSGCKRLNMFLRWVVRNDDIDLGIWKKVLPSDLIIPLDVHVGRIVKKIGITNRKNTGWRTAEEVSENLRKICPNDPIKYDFSLCRLGILKVCPANPSLENCHFCSLSELCFEM